MATMELLPMKPVIEAWIPLIHGGPLIWVDITTFGMSMFMWENVMMVSIQNLWYEEYHNYMEQESPRNHLSITPS